MRNENPTGKESVGMTEVEQLIEQADDENDLKETARALVSEYYELRNEFLGEMRENVRQNRMGGDDQ